MVTPLAYGWEIKFRSAFADRRGDAFQDLFAQIMERRDLGFERVRPWGSSGDRKNDGWSPDRRILFQCYAPSTLTAAALKAKLVEDFYGAVEHWGGHFDDRVFVHNDLDGLAPAIAEMMQELKQNSNGISCHTWGYPQLREEFARLSDSDRAAILGPALTPHDFLSVEARTLQPLLAALGNRVPTPDTRIGAVPPNKLEANHLDPIQVNFLKLGSTRAPLVEQFLTQSFLLPSEADQMAEAVSAYYQELRLAGHAPSAIFDLMMTWVSGGVVDSVTTANSLAILAYYFERCQIFEVPGGAS